MRKTDYFVALIICGSIIAIGCFAIMANSAEAGCNNRRVIVRQRANVVIVDNGFDFAFAQQGRTIFGYDNFSVRDFNRAYDEPQRVESDESEADELTTSAPVIDNQAAQSVVKSSCIVCHGKTNPKGALDLSDLAALNAEQKEHIRDRLTTSDLRLRMPKAKPGATAQQLGSKALDALLRFSLSE